VTELAAARSLVVRPTAAIVRYVEGEVEPERAGRELGVDAVVDGRFQRAGDRLRVTVQLIEIDGGRPLWADKIDSSLSDPFRMQDEISRRVAAALAAELEAPVRRPVRPAADAYELYLRGRAHLARESLADARRAVELLEGAVRADARFALGWAALADAYLMLALEFEPGADHHERAEAACTRALELDADLPEGRYLRGRMAWSERGGWDHARCLAECAVAVAGRPGLHEAWHRLGTVLAHVSLLDAAPLCFARAHEINPHDLSSYEIWGFSRLLRFELEPALAMSDEVWREAPSAWAAYQRGLCRLHLGREGDAEEAVASGLRRFPGSPLVESLAALLAALRGDAGEARRRIASVHENRLAINHYHHAQYELARTLAHLGELGPGFAELEAAAVTGFPCLDFFRRDPLLAPLRSGPQWTSFEARLEREQAGFRRLWSSLAVRV
jgi:tetratricopeptide (TPR) repeat protein